MTQSVPAAKPTSQFETRPLGDRAAVVAATDNASILADHPVLIICSSCGDVVSTYKQGLPEIIAQFDIHCSTCNIQLRRWCAVAVDAAYTELVDAQMIAKLVQSYWDTNLWAGITNERDQPRNDEYSHRYSEKATEFGWDWEPRCPLCRRGVSELPESGSSRRCPLDYHHWSETPDCGVTLCRDCHEIISLHSYDNEAEKRAHEWGLRSRNDLQAICIALHDARITDRQLHPSMAKYLVKRYNLLQSPSEIQLLIKTVLCKDQLSELILQHMKA